MKNKFVLMVAALLFLGPMGAQDTYAQKRSSWQKNQYKFNKKIANDNLNGHYLTLGSSILSSGYYGGLVGFGYEYRHNIFAPNFAVGAGLQGGFLNANIGVKLYLAKNTNFLRNLYFNLLPFCYFGQYEQHKSYYSFENNAIVKLDEFTYPHLYGVGLFFGYAPVWRLNKTVCIGINLGIGIKTTYKFEFSSERFPENQWFPINWDAGVILKLEHYKKNAHFKKLLKTYKRQIGR